MTVRRAVPVLAVSLLTLTMGCAAINRAHERRVQQWEQSGITVAEARAILGTAPYAVPGLEIVAIHVDRPTQVVMVEQRLKPGVLIALSQHRGQTAVTRPRDFLAYEQLHPERVAYSYREADPSNRYVRPTNNMSVPDMLAVRWFTRVTDEMTIRIWGAPVTPQDLMTLLNEAEPIAATR